MNDSFAGSGNCDPGTTSSGLIAGVRTFDPSAWRQLAATYGPLVYSWARRAGLSGADAADITQEVFRVVTLWAGRVAHGRPGDTFRGWLWTVTQNKLRDFWRRRSGQAAATGGSDAQALLQLIPDSESVNESQLSLDLSGALGEAVNKVKKEFEARSWRAFWRVTVDGQQPAEVGRELGMTTNAVYVARSRILRRLREVMSKDPAMGPATPAADPAPKQ